MDEKQNLPKGLIIVDDFISLDDEKSFISFLDEKDGEKWSAITKSASSRRVQHYGYKYDYKSKKTG